MSWITILIFVVSYRYPTVWSEGAGVSQIKQKTHITLININL